MVANVSKHSLAKSQDSQFISSFPSQPSRQHPHYIPLTESINVCETPPCLDPNQRKETEMETQSAMANFMCHLD